MITALWSGLNIVLLAGLVYIFYRAAKLVKQHIGSGAALFFSLGLFLAACHRTDSPGETNVNMLAKQQKAASLGNASAQQNIPVGVGSKLVLLTEYYQEAGVIQPRSLYSTPSGFLLGHIWQPIAGQLQQRDKQLQYSVILKHTWHLLGMPVYSQLEQFDGVFPSSNPL